MRLIMLLLAAAFLSQQACETGYVCQDDLRVCPDGTGLGREGPECKFPKCPPYNPEEFYFATNTTYQRTAACSDSQTEFCFESFDFTTGGNVTGTTESEIFSGTYEIVTVYGTELVLTIAFPEVGFSESYNLVTDYGRFSSGDVVYSQL